MRHLGKTDGLNLRVRGHGFDLRQAVYSQCNMLSLLHNTQEQQEQHIKML